MDCESISTMNDATVWVVTLLIRKALNPGLAIEIPAGTDWQEALDFAISQGVLGLCFEALEKLPANQRPDLEMLMQWYGHTDKQCSQYERTWAVARKLDRLWSAAGIHATVLKGRAIAQYYPVPSHRYSCDLDVFIGHDWERACKLLEEKGVQLEFEVYKEAEFRLDDVYVECHRCITPYRGNKNLQKVERYLRGLLESSRVQDVLGCFSTKAHPQGAEQGVQGRFFEGTTLACPPLMFTVMLYVEHALGDLQQDKLSLKHIVDWVVLRKQDFDRAAFEARCKEFRFDRVLALIEALADVVEGKKTCESLAPSHRRVYDEIFSLPEEVKASGQRSWFRKRVNLFFKIMKNNKNFRDFSYTSMPSFLFNSVWSHFFEKI